MHHAYLILYRGGKRSIISVIESSKAARIIPEFQAEWNLKILRIHKFIRLNQIAFRGTKEIAQNWVRFPLE